MKRISAPFPPLEEVWTQPCGKNAYDSRAAAVSDAVRIGQRKNRQHSKLGATPYACQQCPGKWHLRTDAKDRTP